MHCGRLFSAITSLTLLMASTWGLGAPGDLDPSFGANGTVMSHYGIYHEHASAVFVKADGSVVVGGVSSRDYRWRLVRHYSNGAQSSYFTGDAGYSQELASIGQQSNGKIIVAGDGSSGVLLARYNGNESLDQTFGNNGVVSGGPVPIAFIGGMALQADDKIVVAGSGSSSFLVARYQANGSLDSSFGEGGRVVVPLSSGSEGAAGLAIQNDGKIVVVGHYDSGDLNYRLALLRFDSSGNLDLGFGEGGIVRSDLPWGRRIALQSDGKIVTISAGYESVAVLARHHPDGRLDTEFADGGSTTLAGTYSPSTSGCALAIQPNGKILTATGSILQRFTADGHRDPVFGQNGTAYHAMTIASLAFQADGNLLAAGSVFSTDWGWEFVVARIKTAPEPEIVVEDSDSSGMNLVDGTSTLPFASPSLGAAVTRTCVIRNIGDKVLTGISATVDGGASGDYATQLAGPTTLEPGSSTTIAITFTPMVIGPRNAVLHIWSDDGDESSFDVSLSGAAPSPGVPDPSFGIYGVAQMADDGSSYSTDVAVRSDGSIFASGSSRREDGTYSMALRKYHADGSIDASFGNEGCALADFGSATAYGASVAIQSDGRILVAGNVSTSGGYVFAAARFLDDGTLDPSFNGTGTVKLGSSGGLSIAVGADGTIYVAGSSYRSDSKADFALVCLNSQGLKQWSATEPVSSFSDVAYALALQSDGKIVLAGKTSNSSGKESVALVRYNPGGTLDTTFGTAGKVITAFGVAGASAYDVTIQDDGKIVVAGESSPSASNHDFALVRYHGNGSLDASFGTGGKVTTDFGLAYDSGQGLVLQSDGKIVVAGYTGQNNPDFALARYHPNGTLDSSFGSGGRMTTNLHGAADRGYSVAMHTGRRIVVAGSTERGGRTLAALVGYQTGPVPPRVAIATTDGITLTGATLRGWVDAAGEPTVARFDYGTTPAFGKSINLELSPHDGMTALPVSAVLQELTPGTDYHFRILATNIHGTTSSRVGTFTTLNTNANLANLAPSVGTLQPVFSPDITGYAVVVPYVTHTISFTPTFADRHATMTINGVGVPSGSASAFTLDGSKTTVFQGVVTASDGTTSKDYRVMVIREPARPGEVDMRFGVAGEMRVGFEASGSRFDVAHAVIAQKDGKLIVGGSAGYSGYRNFAVSRHLPDGSLDNSFSEDGKVVTPHAQYVLEGDNIIESLALQEDGKILALGAYGRSIALRRYHPDGSVDLSFSSDGLTGPSFWVKERYTRDHGYGVALQDNGRILVAGTSRDPDIGFDAFALARFDADGNPDPGFGSGGKMRDLVGAADAECLGMALQPDGKIVAVGAAWSGGVRSFAVARYMRNGSRDAAFARTGRVLTPLSSIGSGAHSVAIQNDGKIVVAGFAVTEGQTYTSYSDFAVARYNTDGSLDKTFSGDGKVIVSLVLHSSSTAYNVAIQDDGKIVVGGMIGYDLAGLIRCNSDGTLDASFGDQGKLTHSLTYSKGMMLDSDGTIVMTGTARHDSNESDFAIMRFHGGPKLLVEHPTGTRLVDGSPDGVEFGPVIAGESAVRTIVINNGGTTDLTKLDLTLDGQTDSVDNDKDGAVDEEDENAFRIIGAPALPVEGPSGSTGITLEFKPRWPGTFRGKLHMANSTGDGSFDIALTGSGIGTVAFEQATFTANESDGQADIAIVRLGNPAGSVSVNLSTHDGTALSGKDYQGLQNHPVVFAEGESRKVVSIPLLELSATSEANEQFGVALSNLTGTATMGSPSTGTVRILDLEADAKNPVVSITAPVPNASVLEGPDPAASVVIRGLATDNKGVASVHVKLNDGVFTEAVIPSHLAGGASVTYSLSVSPRGGLNKIEVQSFDHMGNRSAVATRFFTFVKLRPLSLDLSGPVGCGKIASPYFDGIMRQVGSVCTVSAVPNSTPSPGFVFDGWTVNDPSGTGITAAMLERPTLTFTFQEGLALTARFRANPFAGMSGTFTGLVHASPDLPPPSGTVPSVGSEGHFSATVQSFGAFTAKLLIDGSSLNLVGSFDNSGVARFGTSRATSLNVFRPGKAVLNVALNLDLTTTPVESRTIRGTVTQSKGGTVTAASTFVAQKLYYDGYYKWVSTDYLSFGSRDYVSGNFTGFLKAQDLALQPDGLTENDFPQGSGPLTMTVAKNGVVNIIGTLPDNTAFSASTALWRSNVCPLFVQLYKNGGFLSGEITLNAQDADSHLSCIGARWVRPPQNVQHYPQGWPAGLFADLRGAHFGQEVIRTGPYGGSGPIYYMSVLQRPYGDYLQPVHSEGNVALTIEHGGLSVPFTRSLNVSTMMTTTPDIVTKIPANDSSYVLYINRTQGTFSGSFLHEDGTKPPFKGVIYQKGAYTGGHGFFLTTTPKAIDGSGQGGSVMLKGDYLRRH